MCTRVWTAKVPTFAGTSTVGIYLPRILPTYDIIKLILHGDRPDGQVILETPGWKTGPSYFKFRLSTTTPSLGYLQNSARRDALRTQTEVCSAPSSPSANVCIVTPSISARFKLLVYPLRGHGRLIIQSPTLCFTPSDTQVLRPTGGRRFIARAFTDRVGLGEVEWVVLLLEDADKRKVIGK